MTLDIAGDGPLGEAAERFVTSRGSNGHGYVEDPVPLLVGSGLLMVPSLLDAFTNFVLEAFGADTGGIAEMLHGKRLLFSPGDVESLVRKLFLTRESAHWGRTKEICRQRKSEYVFDWTGRFETLLRDLV